MASLDSIFNFLRLLNRFRQVERQLYVNNTDRLENDCEHSYMLAMLAWYLIESDHIEGLDTNKVIKYALVHDLVEAYAGDTFFKTTPEQQNAKTVREAAALKQLEEEFPGAGEILGLIHNYEHRADPESKFVYALDKVIPMLNIYLDNGRTWTEQKITLDFLINKKQSQVAHSPEIEEHFNLFTSFLKERERELFRF